MESELSFIQTQLWIVIGLLVAFVAGNILCHLWNRQTAKEAKDKPEFAEMYDKDEFDSLLSTADSYLQTHPNNYSALYFSALALMARGSYSEAHRRFLRTVELDPTLRSSVQPYLDETSAKSDS